MKYIDDYRDPELSRRLVQAILGLGRRMTVMEVCGTHTMAISRSGLRPLLAPAVELLSGPGCPVCVTSEADVARAIALAELPDVILATFGDMMKVPGPQGTLLDAASRGARVKVVYSPLEALKLARENPGSRVVFLGVGFETTAPTVAASLLAARAEGLANLYVLSLHKRVPPALRALVQQEDFRVEGFILPGHVSVVIGSRPYGFLAEEYGIPCVITGFEPADVLRAVYLLMTMEEPRVEVEYSRAVRPGGNPRAVEIMEAVFEPCGAEWRGLGFIEDSGLRLREEFAEQDASLWEVEVPPAPGERGCRCGDVLCGRIRPTECPLFARVCTPDSPVGPCMVSSEGTCASYYLYEGSGGGYEGSGAG